MYKVKYTYLMGDCQEYVVAIHGLNNNFNIRENTTAVAAHPNGSETNSSYDELANLAVF